MGMLEWLGLRGGSARDAPDITDNVRDSGQTFVFGKADSGEKVDEKSAMQIATAGSWPRQWQGCRCISTG